MLISRKPVQRRGIGEKCGFSLLAGRQQRVKSVSYTLPSPPLPSPSEVKCLFHDQHGFPKQGESAVGGDIVVKDSLCRVGYLTFKVAP